MSGTPLPEPALTDGDPDPEIGQVIDGRYKIIAPLGTGGMGTVYQAEHLGIGKQVAIKLLHAHVSARRDAGARFQREAFAGGRIDHPNCVAVSDFGERADGSSYLVMELLVGESLRDRLDRVGPLPWRLALHLARHVLRGLAYAHAQGVVHRDIKPDNIFICAHDDDREFAKILDFGIAKLLGGAGADATVTQAGMTVGTPSYLSPEQALGGVIGPASDLYSLSIVLYEMLAGRPPFVDEDDPVALLTAHATRAVPAISEVAPQVEVPAAVEALVRRGLAKRAADRYSGAEAYVAAIDHVRVESEPVAIAAARTPFPAMTPVAQLAAVGAAPTATAITTIVPRRRWIAYGAGAILAIGAIAAIASSGSGGANGQPAPLVAPAPDAPPPRRAATGSTRPQAAPVALPPAPVVPPPPAISDAPPDAPASTGTTVADLKLKVAVQDLETGATCAARKQAVATLRELGDARAIPALKKARFRMRGGVLGIGEKNSNYCLKGAAEAAITALAPPK
ncbi:MAG: serine/threonine protein kinase [Deltaproteobacteria bacterium]|nr:serine/threonine protein kinase [Deltaproteobacteria bacterium]